MLPRLRTRYRTCCTKLHDLWQPRVVSDFCRLKFLSLQKVTKNTLMDNIRAGQFLKIWFCPHQGQKYTTWLPRGGLRNHSGSRPGQSTKELPCPNATTLAWNSSAFENGSDTQNRLPGKPILERKPEPRELRIRAQQSDKKVKSPNHYHDTLLKKSIKLERRKSVFLKTKQNPK